MFTICSLGFTENMALKASWTRGLTPAESARRPKNLHGRFVYFAIPSGNLT